MSNQDLIWEEPPPKNSGRGTKYDALLDKLRDHPGEWAMIHEGSRQMQQYLKRVSDESFVFTSRVVAGTEGKIVKVYGRYLG